MRIDKFTHKTQEALQAAQENAERRGHQGLMPAHLLVALRIGEIRAQHELDVAVGDDSGELAVVGYRQVANILLAHELNGFTYRCRNRYRVWERSHNAFNFW